MKTVRLTLPVTVEDLVGLDVGTVVYLDGLIYTGREGLYKRLIDDGIPAPVDLAGIGNVNFHCSPAAAQTANGEFNVGSYWHGQFPFFQMDEEVVLDVGLPDDHREGRHVTRRLS